MPPSSTLPPFQINTRKGKEGKCEAVRSSSPPPPGRPIQLQKAYHTHLRKNTGGPDALATALALDCLPGTHSVACTVTYVATYSRHRPEDDSGTSSKLGSDDPTSCICSVRA